MPCRGKQARGIKAEAFPTSSPRGSASGLVASWDAVSAAGSCSGWMPAGKEAPLSPLPLAGSRFPAAGAGRLLAGVCGESSAVLCSDTRGDPCLGFPGADALFGTRTDCAAHRSGGVLPPAARGLARTQTSAQTTSMH